MSEAHKSAVKKEYRLTRFAPGGIMEVITISYPLMLAALSANLMIFSDRVILARYSLDAMNSASAAAMMYITFAFFGMSITAIAEVFVGQYNGDGKYSKIAVPVWQMIWFSLMLAPIFWPISEFAGRFLIHQDLMEHGHPYFKWMMRFGFLLPLIGALGAFFIGQGKTLLITMAAIIANVLNFFLDIVFVFGYGDIVPSLGAEGSAIASVISQAIQCLILFVVFLSPKHAKKCKTRRAIFNFNIMKKCLNIGLPAAFSHTLEILGWALLPLFLTSLGKSYITVHTINQGVFILFAFFIDGTRTAVTTIAANMLGAHRKELINKLFRSTVFMHLGISLVLLIPMIVYPNLLIDIFLSEESALSAEIKLHSALALKAMWFFFIVDGVVWIIAGILTAGGDTRFILFANILSFWGCAIVPLYIALTYLPSTPSTSGFVILTYPLVNLLLFIRRYFSNKWHKLDLSKEPQ
jgi:multidrug resistance protein, MATE family